MEQPENPIVALRSYISNPPVGSKFGSKQTLAAPAPGAVVLTKSISPSSKTEPDLPSAQPIKQIADEEPFEVRNGIAFGSTYVAKHHVCYFDCLLPDYGTKLTHAHNNRIVIASNLSLYPTVHKIMADGTVVEADTAKSELLTSAEMESLILPSRDKMFGNCQRDKPHSVTDSANLEPQSFCSVSVPHAAFRAWVKQPAPWSLTLCALTDRSL